MVKRSKQDKEILLLFANRLRHLRLLKNITQEELAQQAGFSRSYYTEIETGKRNVSLLNLHRIATCLNISIAELLDVTE